MNRLSKWNRNWRLWATAVVAAGIPVLSGVPTSYAQTDVQVPQGVGSKVLQNATVFGSTPANTPVTVSLILRTRNTVGLQNYIRSTTSPGPNYHHYLSVQQFKQRFGQPDYVVHAISAYFAKFGITTSTYSDNLDITANGTAGQFNQAFAVTLKDMEFDHVRFHGSAANPQLPGDLATSILAVLGLTNYGNFTSRAVQASPQLKPVVPGASQSAGGPPPAALMPTDLAKHYDVNPLYQAGDFGQGQTIGIVTLASMNPSDAYAFWNYNKLQVAQDRIQLLNVDGGAGAVSLNAGSDETTLDVEQSGALAPQAKIEVFQAPNTDYGFADAFFGAVTQNKVDSLSSSWGQSEDSVTSSIQAGQESPNYAQVFNEVFMEAAAQGISTFVASGDQGAYEATTDSPTPTTDLSVDNPSDSPYVTAAGGTTLGGIQQYQTPTQVISINIPQERTWGWDYFYPYWQSLFGAPSEASLAESFVGGSGGGYSTLFATPWYQRGVPGVNHFHAVPWLTPIQNNTAWTFNPNPSVVAGVAHGRNMPDLSMNADPQTGYAVYSTLFSTSGNWAQYGGTSFVAPQLAGITALINNSVGTRVGFWNGQIYRFAQSANSPFHPLDTTGTSNDNLYYTGTKGALYNPGSGLGTPDIAKLAADFAKGSRDR